MKQRTVQAIEDTWETLMVSTQDQREVEELRGDVAFLKETLIEALLEHFAPREGLTKHTSTQRDILALKLKNPHITLKELANKFKTNRNSVRIDIETLTEQGYLEPLKQGVKSTKLTIEIKRQLPYLWNEQRLSVSAIAEKFNVTPKRIQQLVSKLRKEGQPLEYRWGHKKGHSWVSKK